MTCCYINTEHQGCENRATFEIRDMSDPDPYSCYTPGCEDHVGALLGHRLEIESPVDRWEVTGLPHE